jgi:hypothetical protein
LTTGYNSFFSSNPEIVFKFIVKTLNLSEDQRSFLEAKIKEDDFKNDIAKDFKDTIPLVQERIRNEQILMVLAQLFSVHNEHTRYPDNVLSKNPIKIYNSSNILIKNLRCLYHYQEQVLLFLINN